MRDVLPELMAVVGGRRDRRRRHRRRDLPLRPAPGGRLDAGRPRRARPSARCPAAASRARSTSSASRWSTSGAPVLERYGVSDDDAFAVGLTCGGILDVYVEKVLARDLPRARGDRRRHRGRPPGRPGHRDRAPRPGLARAGGWWCDPTQPPTGALGSPRADDAVHDDALGLLAAGTNATLTYGPDGERRGEGMRVFVWALRAQAADAGLRRDRLRGRGGPGRLASSATT